MKKPLPVSSFCIALICLSGVICTMMQGCANKPPIVIFHQATVDAAKHCKADKLKALIHEDKARANARGFDQDHFLVSALHAAAKANQPTCIKVLLSAGANLYAYDSQGTMALHAAVANDSEDAIRALHAAGFDLEARSWTHKTALHLSFLAKRSTSKLLLELGANVNAKTSDQEGEDMTALHFHSCLLQDAAIIRMLLDFDADPALKAKIEPNAAPLSATECIRKSGNRELMQLLSKH
jgi:ankyrin repeat protein